MSDSTVYAIPTKTRTTRHHLSYLPRNAVRYYFMREVVATALPSDDRRLSVFPITCYFISSSLDHNYALISKLLPRMCSSYTILFPTKAQFPPSFKIKPSFRVQFLKRCGENWSLGALERHVICIFFFSYAGREFRSSSMFTFMMVLQTDNTPVSPKATASEIIDCAMSIF